MRLLSVVKLPLSAADFITLCAPDLFGRKKSNRPSANPGRVLAYRDEGARCSPRTKKLEARSIRSHFLFSSRVRVTWSSSRQAHIVEERPGEDTPTTGDILLRGTLPKDYVHLDEQVCNAIN